MANRPDQDAWKISVDGMSVIDRATTEGTKLNVDSLWHSGAPGKCLVMRVKHEDCPSFFMLVKDGHRVKDVKRGLVKFARDAVGFPEDTQLSQLEVEVADGASSRLVKNEKEKLADLPGAAKGHVRLLWRKPVVEEVLLSSDDEEGGLVMID